MKKCIVFSLLCLSGCFLYDSNYDNSAMYGTEHIAQVAPLELEENLNTETENIDSFDNRELENITPPKKTPVIEKNTEDGVNTFMQTVQKSATTTPVMELLPFVNLEEEDSLGNTALFYALSNPNTDILELLLQQGANVHHKNNQGYTPLMMASMVAVNPSAIHVLVFGGANIEEKNADGFTPLMFSLATGHGAITKALLENGANIDSRTKRGWTPLIVACLSGKNAAALAHLVNKGVDINQKTASGLSPLMMACIANASPDFISALINLGADINAQDNYGNTAKMYASLFTSNANVLTTLDTLGADNTIRNNQDKTALDYLKENPNIKIQQE